MTPRVSKLVLTSHVTFSVGWIGAVAVFLTLAITGLNSHDTQLATACLIAMKLSAWFVIVPFCLTSLGTGVVQAIFTEWGLFKHYWIVVKLFLTVASTILLLLHMQPITYLSGAATNASFSSSQHSWQIINLITKAGAAILALLATTTISIYKPWGRIQFKKRPLSFYMLIALVSIIVVFMIIHSTGGGMGH